MKTSNTCRTANSNAAIPGSGCREGRVLSYTRAYMFLRNLCIVALAMAGLCLASPAEAAIKYVTATGTGDGSSWANASSDIKTIVGEAVAGDQVYVGAGTYSLTSEVIIPSGVSVLGGFPAAGGTLATRNPASYVTTLSQTADTRVVTFTDITDAQARLLDGFTVTGGKPATGHGGGIVMNQNASVKNCIVTGNKTVAAGTQGGGIHVESTAVNAVIDNCIIQNNYTLSGGGGTNSVGNVTITRCDIRYNESAATCAGFRFAGSGVATIANCRIFGNWTTANSDGGGGGFYGGTHTAYNLLVYNNNSGFGTGIRFGGNNTTTLTNCTVVNNRNTRVANAAGVAGYSTGGSMSVRNCIIYNNINSAGNEMDIQTSAGLDGDYNAYGTSPSAYSGTHNITVATNPGWVPLFVKAPSFIGLPETAAQRAELENEVDFRLQRSSLMVNKGDPANVITPDYYGNVRPQGAAPDIGVFELDVASGSPTFVVNEGALYLTPYGRGTGDGSSWSNAAAEIRLQEALNSTATKVYLEAGTYTNNGTGSADGSSAFTLPESKLLEGGYSPDGAGTFNPSKYVSTLTLTSGTTGKRVILLNANGVLRGCTVTGGNGVANGGGIHAGVSSTVAANCVIDQCVVSDNKATTQGGGIWITGGTVTKTTIVNNESASFAGGIYTAQSFSIINCRILNNTGTAASGEGGGFFLNGNGTGAMINCLISGNAHGAWGMAGTPNSKENHTFYHCTFVNNGGAKEYFSGGGGTYHNCLIWEAAAVTGCNNNGVFNYCTRPASFTNGTWGNNNITLPYTNDNGGPMFINPSTVLGKDANWATRDWHLALGSPCMDIGSTLTEPAAALIDYDGVARPQYPGGKFDVGMYETIYPTMINLSFDNPTSNGSTPPVLTVLLDRAVPAAVSIPIVYSGTAPTSFHTLPTSITVPAGSSTGTASLLLNGVRSSDIGTIIATVSEVTGTILAPEPLAATLTLVADASTPARDADGLLLITSNAELTWFATHVADGNKAMKGKIAADFELTDVTNLPMEGFTGILGGVAKSATERYSISVTSTAFSGLINILSPGVTLGGFDISIDALITIGHHGFITWYVDGGTINDMKVTVNAALPQPTTSSVGAFGRSRAVGTKLTNVTVRIAPGASLYATSSYGVGAFFSDLEANASTTFTNCTVLLDGLLGCGNLIGGFGGQLAATHTVTLTNCAVVVSSTGSMTAATNRGLLFGNAAGTSTLTNIWLIYDDSNTNIPRVANSAGTLSYNNIYTVAKKPVYEVVPGADFSIITRYTAAITPTLTTSPQTAMVVAQPNGYLKYMDYTAGAEYPTTFVLTPPAALNRDVPLSFAATLKASTLLVNNSDIVIVDNNDKFMKFNDLVVNNHHTMRGVTVQIAGDISITADTAMPMGTMVEPYAGNISGVVTNLGAPRYAITMNKSMSAAEAGLFGRFTGNMENIHLIVPSTTTVTGTNYAGSLMAYLTDGGTIRNCHVDLYGTVAVANAGGTDANYRCAGGMLGRIWQPETTLGYIVNNCKVQLYDNAKIQVSGTAATARCAGGLVGYSNGGLTSRNVLVLPQNAPITAPAGSGTVEIGLYAGRLQGIASVDSSFLATYSLGNYGAATIPVASGTTASLVRLAYGVISMTSRVAYELGSPALSTIYHGSIATSTPYIGVNSQYQLYSDAVGSYPQTILTYTSTEVPEFQLPYDIAVATESTPAYFVTVDGGMQAVNDGSSWNAAFSASQLLQAISKAASEGKEVRIAGGTYTLADNTPLNIPAGVKLIGSYTVLPDGTGKRAKPDTGRLWDFTSPTIFQPATSTQWTSPLGIVYGTIDGCVFQNGNTSLTGYSDYAISDGGILQIRAGSLLNSIVRNSNFALRGFCGGALAFTNGAGKVSGCYLHSLSCTSGSSRGAGINSRNGGGSVIENSELRNIRGVDWGAAVTAKDAITMKNCVVANCTSSGGSASVIYGEGTITAYNCTIVRNAMASTAGSTNLYNCIIWGNNTNNGGTQHCAVQGLATAVFDLSANNTGDPNSPYFKVINDTAGYNQPGWDTADWSLTQQSYLINRGRNSLYPFVETATEIKGVARVFNYGVGGAIDLGAFEFQGPGFGTYAISATPLVYNGVNQIPTIAIDPAVYTDFAKTVVANGGSPTTNAGTYSLSVTNADPANWTISPLSTTFTIAPLAVTDAQVIANDGVSSYVYSGEQQPAFISFADISPSPSASDYDMTVNGERTNVTAAGYNIVVAMKGNYANTITKNIKITPKPVTFTVLNPTAAYSSTVWPDIVLSETLSNPADYTIKVTRGANTYTTPGEIPDPGATYADYNVLATMVNANYGVGAALGKTDVNIGTFRVAPSTLQTVTITNTQKIYNGSPQGVTVTLTDAAAGLTPTVAYNAVAEVPTNAGSYAVRVSVTNGTLYGGAGATLLIAPYAMTVDSLVIPSTSLLFTNAPLAPAYTLKSGVPTMVAADYTTRYEDVTTNTVLSGMPTAPGSYRMIITYTRNFSGSITIPYTIIDGKIRYVTVAGNGDKDGRDWANAADASKIQSFIDLAPSGAVTEIRLAAGIYTNDADENNAYLLKGGVIIRGGYNADDGTRDIVANKTYMAPANATGEQRRVLYLAADQSATVEGIYFHDITTMSRTASSFDGAVAYLLAGATLTLDQCDIARVSSNFRGVLYIHGVVNATLNITRTKLYDCDALWGVIHTENAANQKINVDRSIFVNNVSRTAAANAGLFHVRSTTLITNSVFAGNPGGNTLFAPQNVGSVELRNCTIAKNGTDADRLNTIVGNTNPVTLKNSFIWSTNLGNATPDYANCIVSADPNFNPKFAETIDYTSVDAMLNASWAPGIGSPLINWGNNVYVTTDSDYHDVARIYSPSGEIGLVDVGAVESTLKGLPKFVFTDMQKIYNGNVQTPSVTVNGNGTQGLTATLSYNPTPTVNAGLYQVTATVNTNSLWEGAGTDTMIINKLPIDASAITVVVPVDAVGDGQPHGIVSVSYMDPFTSTVVPVPSSEYTVTYNGGTAEPTLPGIYHARVTLNVTNYTGGKDATYSLANPLSDVQVTFPAANVLVYDNTLKASSVVVTGKISGVPKTLVAGVDYFIDFYNTRPGANNPTIPIDAGDYNVNIVIPEYSDSFYPAALVINARPVTTGELVFTNTVQLHTGGVLGPTISHSAGYPILASDYTSSYTLNGVPATPSAIGIYSGSFAMRGNYQSTTPVTMTFTIVDENSRYITLDGAGLKNGYNWDNAAPFTALDTMLATPATKIYFAGNTTYTAAPRADAANHCIVIPAGKGIYGGYDIATGRQDFTHPSILTISAEAQTAAKGVVNVIGSAIIDGFSVTGGRYSYGNIRVDNTAAPTVGGAKILNCRVYGNTSNGAIGNGAGMVIGVPNVTVGNCYFAENTLPGDNSNDNNGGGIFVNSAGTGVSIHSCYFTKNYSRRGSGVAIYGNNGQIDSCIMITNSQSDMGAIMVSAANTKITRCIVANNTGGNHGVGIRLTSATNGSAPDNTLIENCIIANNGGGQCAGVMVQSSNNIIRNCAIVNNASSSGAVAAWEASRSVSVQNCVFWNNEKDIYAVGTVTVSNTAIPGGYAGTANLTLNTTITNDAADGPRFTAPYTARGYDVNATDAILAADYRLMGTSTMIGKGNPSYYTAASTDLDGNSRLSRGAVDIGPYQFSSLITPSVIIGNLIQREGTPLPVTVQVTPNDVVWSMTFDGEATQPTAFGSYDVTVTTEGSDIYKPTTTHATLTIHNGRLYVTENGAGIGGGTSWSDAGAGAAALTRFTAASSVDTVFVAGGTYTVTGTIAVGDGMQLYGSYLSSGGSLPSDRPMAASAKYPWEFLTPTIITGSITNRLVTTGKDVVLDGLTLQGGTDGGLQVNGGNGTYRNMVVRDNTRLAAGDRGCGITIAPNTSDAATVMNGNVFDGLWIHNNVFTGNTGATYFNHCGAAIGCGQNFGADYTVKNSIVTANKGPGVAGFWVRNKAITVINTLFANNETVSQSTAYPPKAAVLEAQTGTLNIINCTIVSNKSATSSVASVIFGTLNSYNTVYWNNATGTVAYTANGGNAVRGAEVAGQLTDGNIRLADQNTINPETNSLGPNFTNPSMVAGAAGYNANADWTLTSASPLINFGLNNRITEPKDLAGNARIYTPAGVATGYVDIGVFESTYKGNAEITASDRVTDYDGTPKTVTITVKPTNVQATTRSYTDAGTYTNIPVYIPETDPLWHSTSTSFANLTINPAVISAATYSCDSGTIFPAGFSGNNVTIRTYTVTPAQTVAMHAEYTPVSGGTASKTFPSVAGDYWVSAVPTDTPANYVYSAVPRIVISVLNAPVGASVLTMDAPIEVTEGDTAAVRFTLYPAPMQDVTVNFTYPAADWTGPTSVVVPANVDSVLVELTSLIAGATRNSAITYTTSVPVDSVVAAAGLSVTIQINKGASVNYRYVSVEGSGQKTGYNWANALPLTTLPTALRDSSILTFYIAEGDYTNSVDGFNSFYLDGNKKLIGGYSLANPEIRDPDRFPTTFFSAIGSGRRTFYLTGTRTEPLLFDGINMYGGGRDGGSAVSGGAAMNVRNCYVDSMTCTAGGIFSVSQPSTFYNVRFRSNTNSSGSEAGGAIRVTGGVTVTIDSCIFQDNNAYQGAAIGLMGASTVKATNSKFYRNAAVNNGGAISMNDASSTVNLSFCDFVQNTGTWASVLVMANATSGATVNVNGCRFAANTCNEAAQAGVFHIRGNFVANSSLFLNNTGPGSNSVFGIVTAAEAFTTATITNCTIVGNNGGQIANSTKASFYNSIIYNNSSNTTTGTATDCWTTNPSFVAPVNFIGFTTAEDVAAIMTANYSLAPTSMAINYANNAWVVGKVDSDYAGNSRIYIGAGTDTGFVDYGAIEFQGKGNGNVTVGDVFFTYTGDTRTINYTIAPAVVTGRVIPAGVKDAGTHVQSAGIFNDPIWNDNVKSATVYISQATVSMSVQNVMQVYNGQPVPVTPVTVPTGVRTAVIYKKGAILLPSAPVEVGTYTAEASIADTNYVNVTRSATVTIQQASPVVTVNPAATPIYSDEPLSHSTLSGGTVTGVGDVVLTGSWAWVNPATIPGDNADQPALFTPVDTNYKAITATITLPLLKIGYQRYVRVGADGSGRTWDLAMGDIQAAINDLHAMEGDTPRIVYVDKGIYVGNYVVNNNVSIIGGFDVANGKTAIVDCDSTLTILDGDAWGTVIRQTVDAVAPATFRSITVRNGFGMVAGEAGGMSVGANATVMDCIITGNSSFFATGGLEAEEATITGTIIAGNSGYHVGGLYADGSTIVNCIIANNASSNDYNARAGGLYAVYSDVSNSTITGNVGRGYGAGGAELYETLMSQTAITGNSAQHSGGGLYVNASSLMALTIEGNIIDGSQYTLDDYSTPNAAGAYLGAGTDLSFSTVSNNTVSGLESAGGGLVLDNATVTHTFIRGNRVLSEADDGLGAGVYATSSMGNAVNTVSNSLIADNMDSGYGAAVSGANIVLLNVTMAGNTSSLAAPSVVLTEAGVNTITNSILWDTDSAILCQNGAVANVSYSVVKGGWAGIQNTALAPLLDADYKPMTGSASINLGSNAANTATVDLAGNARIYGGVGGLIDAGCYEFEGKGIVTLAYVLPEYAAYKTVYTGSPIPYPATCYTLSPNVQAVMDITYSSGTAPTNAGTYNVTIAVNDPNWEATNSLTPTLTILPLDMTNNIAILTKEFTYNATPRKPTFSAPTEIAAQVFFPGEADSTVAPTNAGSYPFVVAATAPNYVGSKGDTMVIVPASATIVINQAVGSAGTVASVMVTASGLTPTPADYTVEYAAQGSSTYSTTAPTAVGTYKVRVTCIGNYTGTAERLDGLVIRAAMAVAFLDTYKVVNEDAISATFDVKLSTVPTAPITVPFEWSVVGGQNVTVSASPLTFAANQQTATVTVNFTQEARLTDRYVTLRLISGEGATVTGGTATLVVKNIDPISNPTVAFDGSDTTIGIGGSASVTLTLANPPASIPSSAKVWFSITTNGAPAAEGVDYTLTGPTLTKLSGSLYEGTFNVDKIELTLTALTTNLPRNKNVVVTILRVFNVDGCTIMTPNTMTFAIREVVNGLYAFSAMPFMGVRQALTLPVAVEASQIRNEEVSTLGATVTSTGSDVVYDFAASSFTLSDAALAAGIADTFMVYALNDTATATEIVNRVYVATARGKGEVISLPFDVVRERSGLDFVADRFTRTPFLYASYYKPYEATVAATKVMLKTGAVPLEGADAIDYCLNLQVKLFNTLAMQQARAAGKFTADVMNDPACQKAECGLEIVCSSTEPVVDQGPVAFEKPVAAMVIKPPRLTDVAQYISTTGDIYLRVEGDYLGNAPTVALEYLQDGVVKTLSIARATADLELLDPEATLMTVTAEEMLADNAVWVRLPAKMPVSERIDITVNSGCGVAGTTLSK